MRHYIDCGLLSPALSIFSALARSSLPPSLPPFLLLLRAATAASDVPSALLILRRILDLRLRPPPDAYHSVIRIASHRGHIEEAWQLLRALGKQEGQAGGALQAMLPVLPLLFERSTRSIDAARFTSHLADLHPLLVSRRDFLLSSPFFPSSLSSSERRELLQLDLALLSYPSPSHSATPSIISRTAERLFALRPDRTERADLCRRLISAYSRAAAWEPALQLLRRWTGELKAERAHAPSHRRSALALQLSVQQLLMLSRALYMPLATAEQAVAEHEGRVERLLALLTDSGLPPDERTLQAVLCCALPADDTAHLSLIARLRQQVLMATPDSVPDLPPEAVSACRALLRRQGVWVMSALTLHSLHPSHSLLSLLLYARSHSITSLPELHSVLSLVHTLRSTHGVQPSYPTLHSLLHSITSHSRTHLIPHLLSTFTTSFALPPTTPSTLHLLASYAHRIAHSPSIPLHRRLAPLQLLLSLPLTSPLPLPTLLSVLSSYLTIGGVPAYHAATRLQSMWEGLGGVEGVKLGLRCWMEGGSRGLRRARGWWWKRCREEERVQREGGGGARGSVVVLALDEGVVAVVVEGLRQWGEDEAALDVADHWTRWDARIIRQATEAQRKGDEELLDEL